MKSGNVITVFYFFPIQITIWNHLTATGTSSNAAPRTSAKAESHLGRCSTGLWVAAQT